jgi:hypothetical protein
MNHINEQSTYTSNARDASLGFPYGAGTPYAEAKRLYTNLHEQKQQGDNFDAAVTWMQENGVVISLPTTFLMGYFSTSQEPTKPIAYDDADCVYVVLCVGDPVAALEQLVEMVDYAAYNREFRGDEAVRVVLVEKLYYQL